MGLESRVGHFFVFGLLNKEGCFLWDGMME